jgi:glycosyltransferase involved in cell wall biosynthesis
MRVLHVSSGNLYGGVESMLLTLARHSAKRGVTETEIALCFDGRSSRELETTGVTLHRLPTPRARSPFAVLCARQALARLLRGGRYERVICHGQWTHAIFGATVRRSGVALVLWVHGPLTGRHWSERWAGRTRPDLAVCTSRFTARTLPNLYDDLPSIVIHPPVDLAAERLSLIEREQIRQELDTRSNAVVLIQASRTEAWKGHSLLVEALGLLRGVPGWVWWQVGGPQRPFEAAYLDSLRTRASELRIADRVRFVGERPDVRRLLAAANVYCQANLNPEPFGIAFVEALAAGLPVVTVAMGGALEIVDDSCGMLVPPADPSRLAAALERLIADPALRVRLSAAAPARARTVSDAASQVSALERALAAMSLKVAV